MASSVNRDECDGCGGEVHGVNGLCDNDSELSAATVVDMSPGEDTALLLTNPSTPPPGRALSASYPSQPLLAVQTSLADQQLCACKISRSPDLIRSAICPQHLHHEGPSASAVERDVGRGTRDFVVV